MSRAFSVFHFLCKLPGFFQLFLLFWGFGQHLFAVADKIYFCCNCFLFMLFLLFIGLLYLCFLVIWLYNENPCHNFYFFAYSIRFLIFLLLTSSLLKFLQGLVLFSHFLVKLLSTWLKQMFARAFNPGLTRMWERVIGITSKTDLSAFSCLLFYSL